MRRLIILVLAGTTTSASAQTGTYTWQVSNNGATWGNTAFAIPGQTVHVRLLASWAGVTGSDVGFAGGQFDATILGSTAAANVSNIQRPAPFAFATQTLVASSYGSGIKIDTSADLAPPGAGTGWVNPGQAARDFAAAGTYNSNNPCIVLQYDYIPDDLAIFSMVLNGTTGRALSVYINSGGTQQRINASAVIVETAHLVPAASSMSLLATCALTSARRQRRVQFGKVQSSRSEIAAGDE